MNGYNMGYKNLAPNMVQPSQQDYMQMMMNRMMAIRMAQQDQQQYEAGLPANLQWADAGRRATNAGTDFQNTVMTPEMAKARTSTAAGGLGAATNSFQKAKQNSLQAALGRQKQGVQNDAETSAIQQIGMMRGGTMQGPQNAQTQFQSSYSDPYSQSGYRNQFQQPSSGFDNIYGMGVKGLGLMQSANQMYPQLGQWGANAAHGIGGFLGGVGSKLGGLFGGSQSGSGSGQQQPFGKNEFSPNWF